MLKTKKKTKPAQGKNELINILLGKVNNLLVFFVVYVIYILTAFPTVQSEDSGELIVSAVGLDVAHPPGYPLYVLVGKLFSLLVPFGNMAWRINIMSGVFGAATAHILYVILKKKTKNDLIAFGTALLYAFTNIIWGQSNRAEVYTLNTFCLGLIVYMLMRWHEDKKSKWLLLSALTFGLGVGNHHLLLLAAPAFGLYVLIKNWKTIINPKIVFGSLGLLLIGLSVYAYLPIRTYLAPYDNPAFIEHSGLYTWEKFIGFVNRKIYGGTVNIPGDQATQEASAEHLPAWIVGIKDFFADYGGRLVTNNAKGLLPLLKIITAQYFYLPLFLFLPGLYYLFKKDPRWASLIALLFVCYTVIMLVFTPIDADTNDYIAFSTEPFMMPAILVMGIIIGEGLAWLHDAMNHKKGALAFSVICLVPALFALQKNFIPNNESRNYLAYDFNKMALASVPPNGYLISIGRDNMTFPLYYLRKIENFRTDVHLEIYYSTSPVDEVFLQSRVAQNGGKPVFIDLLPPNYAAMGLKPYNFVYQYGEDPGLPPATLELPLVRGIRKDLDYPHTRLKFLYEIKTGIMEKNPVLKRAAFDEVINAPGNNEYYLNIIGDYAYYTGDFETAKKAYEKSGNKWGLEQVNDSVNNPDHVTDWNLQTGMS